MPALLERPKMTKLMYQTLKRHILSERERKKQAEQEQDAMLEQQRKEREMKKKKEEDNNLTIEQTKEQISQLEKKLEQLKAEKHELFSQLKKVLHQEDETRKRAQLKEQSELMSVQAPYTHPAMPPVSGHSLHLGRPTMYRPTQSMITVSSVPNVPMKRPRSPSPTPTTGYQHQYESKKAVAMYSHAQDFKQGTYPAQAQQGQVTFVSQPVHSFQQSTVSYSTSKPTPGKYQPAGQSAFSTYPSHYAQHQKTIPDQPYPAAYQMQRLQQPGYLASPHSANIPLQQQLQHANEKAGFNDGEKYKMQQPAQIRGVNPIQGQQPGMLPISLQQEMPGRGSIVTGFSGRSQAPPTSSYQPSSSQVMYPGQQPSTTGRSGYSNQGRYH
ncbi:G protein pathway suppressor 2-like isoform X2 [Mercenaria mercenaria]|uniref:G protein pathway suppressor 2-like isoform X2 n=1 Tax=Mercenaria mercenaria TaxID=6596 RepID=UPI00234EE2C1|nr:G protein pathway suppressor 2-like isoform X2 [Mercenaria mercenaria]